jgi:hypothetical protein
VSYGLPVESAAAVEVEELHVRVETMTVRGSVQT